MKSRKIVLSKPFVVEIGHEEFDAGCVPDETLAVRTNYTLVSPGTELSCLAGLESWFPLPNTPGYTATGTVIAVGGGVEGFAVGDRVFFYGGNREYQLVPVSEFVMKIPAGVDEKLVPFVRIATIAMTALRVSPMELGDLIVVSGLGPVGNLAVQLVKQAGGRCVAIDPSAARRELALKCGADAVFDPADSNLAEEIGKRSGGRGADAVIEASGQTGAIEQCLPLIRPLGDMVLLGTPRAPYETNATAMYRQSHDGACVTVKAASEWRYPVKHEKFVKHSMECNSAVVFDLLQSGKLAVDVLLSHVLPPEEAPAAYEGVRNDKEKFFGVIFDWTR